MTSCGADILLVVAQHKFGGTGRVEEARGNPEHDRPAPHILQKHSGLHSAGWTRRQAQKPLPVSPSRETRHGQCNVG
jgi:hypothetical protein